MIYSIHIFDRHCDCIFRDQYLQGTALSALDPDEHAKLVYGVIYSVRNLVAKLRHEPAADAPFLAYATSHYKLHYYETPTSLKFVLMTGPNVNTVAVRDILKSIYRDIYVEHVAKNPLAIVPTGSANTVPVLDVDGVPTAGPAPKPPKAVPPTGPPAAYITNVAFKAALDRLIRGLIQANSD
ncbi:TRAPP subunit bet5 [Allomyces arbusculus]|nr:TRAPP subunit bet5 [Allomyces arbusculus]